MPQLLLREEGPKYTIKVVTMTNPVVGWYHLMHAYDDETVIMTTNLKITWMNRYTGYKEMNMTIDLNFI